MAQLPTHNPSLPFIKQNWTGNLLNKKQQYINLDGPSERTFAELFKWQTEKNPLKPLKQNQRTNVEVILNQQITQDNDDGITWLGHASFVFSLNKKQFIVDPVLYNVGPLKRFTQLPCDIVALKNNDFILLSHNHRDHADKKSMMQVCGLNPSATILTGLNIAPLLRSWGIRNTIVEAGWYQRYQLKTDVEVTYLPAKHWNRRGLNDMNDMLWGSFMLQSGAQTIYFGADSGLGVHYPETAELFPNIDVAILGIGAYKPEWFMGSAHTSPTDALLAFEQLKAKQLIPMHHGTFDLGDEPIFYPKQELLLLEEQQGITAVNHLSIGKKLHL